MHPHSGLIADAHQVPPIVEKLQRESIIAFDTEFIREKTFFPVLEILQIATERESWLIDAQAFLQADHGNLSALRPLLDVLENPAILKTVHAAHGDQEALFHSFGIVPKPILDTSLAASLCGYGESVGLGTLLKSVLRVSLKKVHSRTHWSLRPLPPQLLEYAHADVIYLVALGKALLHRLDQRGRREWALALSRQYEDLALYEPKPEEIARRLFKSGRLAPKDYPVLLELVRWREQRIREINVPRKWLSDDSTLMTLAAARPQNLDQLRTFRGISKNDLSRQGEAILDAIRRGEQGEPLSVEPQEHPSAEESRVIDLIRVFVNLLADEHEVAAKYLLDSSQYSTLLQLHPESPEDLVAAGILSPQAAALIGHELIEFLHGNRSLSIQDGRITVVDPETCPPRRS
ncbi:MAG TPA: HRDC domain-containing protein [bacterium]|nr:HRDC domain-containing protein [bacterium]HOL94480.1 HRDC domain-containing protein [bacterium]